MSKERILAVSFLSGLLLTGLTALVPTNAMAIQCAYSSGNGPLDELALKTNHQKQLGLPLPYYVKQEPAVKGCLEITDRDAVMPGFRPVRLIADIVIWSGLSAGILYMRQKLKKVRHA